jgi:hypothetical protein
MSTPSAPLDSASVARIRASFARQGAMATLGAKLAAAAATMASINRPGGQTREDAPVSWPRTLPIESS